MRERSSSRQANQDESRWAAVVRRDRRQDGHFVFAVATTGVFCRPSCGARQPLRRNVRFFDTGAGAAAAGFRPCKRCKPHSPDESVALAAAVRAALDAAGDTRLTLAQLARRTRTSPSRVQRAFLRATGMSPREYQDTRRADRLRTHLRAGRSVTRATIDAGYASTSRLHRDAREALGMTPHTFRKKGAGMQIRFGTTSTPLGAMLVGFTDRGVCAVSIGDDPRALERELRDQFSAAEVGPATDADRAKIDRVVGAVLGGDAAPALDLNGTDFQLLVWRALQRIPRGQTRSYGELARTIGRPTATRAVATACASNRVAVLVPCHRVIRQDGADGGYRWGVQRKRWLLDREGSASKP